MKKLFLLLNHFFAFAYMASAQNALPDTDIFICDVELKNGKYSFTNLKNITSREGYDNQPSFIDNNTILYTSIREDKQADIYKYDLKTGNITQLTNTPEDEYSPTLMPDGKHISTVRVEKDSTQRLWKFPLVYANDFSLVLPDVKGVGYHCWGDSQSLFLFILGKPFTLQSVSYNLDNNKYSNPLILDSFIGRSIQRVSKHTIAYVSKSDTLKWKIAFKGMNYVSIELPQNCEDFVYSTKRFWVGNESKLLVSKIKKKKYVWQEVFDFKGTPAENFYRIAFSPDGKKLALVSYVGKKP